VGTAALGCPASASSLPPARSPLLYHVSVHELAERVLGHIRREELLRPGDRIGVAVSGGIDSVALLRLLIELRQELGIFLSVVHFNHKLRGAESDADQEFVADLAREHGLEFYSESGDVAQLAAEEHSGVEAAARELRYGFFNQLLGAGESHETDAGVPQGLKPETLRHLNSAAEATPFQRQNQERSLSKIVTGHTLDDQAETVLMRLIRGTGMRGLGGIYPRIAVEHEDEEGHGEIIRPLLVIRRKELEQYLNDLKQPWREDSSNADARFTRNRVRSLVLPLLEREFNPAVVESFAELAEIARDEEDYWENEISGWLGTVVQWSVPAWTREVQDISFVQIEPVGGGPSQCVPMDFSLRFRIDAAPWLVMNVSVSRPWLLTEPRAVQRRAVKAIGEHAGIPLEFKHIDEILRFAAEAGPSGKELSLPLGWKLVREPEAVVFLTPDLRRHQEPVPDYEYALPVPGRVFAFEAGAIIEALRIVPGASTPGSQPAEYNPQQLLRADLLSRQLTLRNWRPGDRFWPAHTKGPKKIKELLQEKRTEQPRRRLWPVAISGDEIVWMRGFPVPAKLRAKAGEEAVLIRETPLWAEERTI
jgi:tRNA(Ile)-lysidine synthase